MRCLACILVLLYGVGVAQAGLKSEAGTTASQSSVKACRSTHWTAHTLTVAACEFRNQTWAAHPCVAAIVDVEDPSWDPTVSYGGGHNVNDSYGLGQANPGTKMSWVGRAWATSRVLQLRWTVSYAVSRYGSECAAWDFRRSHGWY